MGHRASWHPADLLDFEYLLAADAAQPDEALRARDHAFVEAHRAMAHSRGELFRAWIESRREQASAQLPGETLRLGWDLTLAGAALAGLLIGASVCAAVLRFPGLEPVNVSVFLGATLGPQFVIPPLLAVAALVLRVRVWARLFSHFVAWLGSHLRRLPGDSRQAVQVTLATLERRRESYGALAMWPLVIATQVFAVAFNVGIIATLLAHVPTRELRFGWQTTLEAQPADVAALVHAVALPWGWAPHAHPTPEQIFVTRFAPGQAMSTLPGEAARAWWPFLAYAVCCYGLVLRGVVLGFAWVRLRSGMRALRFDHADANALWRRVAGPLIAAPEQGATLQIPQSSETSAPHRATSGGTCVLLAATDCVAPDDELAREVARTFPWQAAKTLRVKIDSRRDNAAALAAVIGAAPEAVVVAVPIERDPIVAIGLFLGEVVKAAPGAEVMVWLVGPADSERRKYWRDFLAIHRLPIGVELSRSA